jgi:mono/diheme cytochrome c family protein
LQKAQQIALLAGMVSAVIASITGYLLSRSGDYDLSAVALHQWSGILTSVFTLLALIIKKIQRLLIWTTVVALVITGHFGGELTHGEGYLDGLFNTTPSPSNQDTEDVMISADTLKSTPDTIPQSITYSPYQSNIVPLLESNCYSCHSSKKKNGGLRLDSEQWIKAGGKNGLILTSGNPEKSILYTHLRLPLEDEKHMPPKGKKQLNNGQINTIFEWIKMGAPFGEIEKISAQETATIFKSENTVIIRQDSQQIIIQEIEKLTPLKATDPTIIQSLVAQEIVIKPVAKRENGLYVSLMNTKKISPCKSRTYVEDTGTESVTFPMMT